MNTIEQRQKHYSAIELLEAIDAMKRRLEGSKKWVHHYKENFPRLYSKTTNEIDTRERAINRLKERYNKQWN